MDYERVRTGATLQQYHVRVPSYTLYPYMQCVQEFRDGRSLKGTDNNREQIKKGAK
jgi:hypothetical protein